MSKDPAVLFYTSDFISGTLTMSHEQRGKYILLLCLQHQKGYLTEKDMLIICLSYDEDIWQKFENIDGKFYNMRMKVEAERRAAYSQSRSKNRTKDVENKKVDDNIENTSMISKEHIKNISKTYNNHMETETENENENINKNININIKKEEKKKERKKTEKFEPPTEKDVIDYFTENGYSIEAAKKVFKYYNSANWHDSKGNPVKNWKQKMIAVWFRPENKKEYEPYIPKYKNLHEDPEYNFALR